MMAKDYPKAGIRTPEAKTKRESPPVTKALSGVGWNNKVKFTVR